MGIISSTPEAQPPLYSEIVPGSEVEGASPIYRCRGFGGKLVTVSYPDVKTYYDAFQRGLSLSRDRPCFGYRPVTSTGVGDYIFSTCKISFLYSSCFVEKKNKRLKLL